MHPLLHISQVQAKCKESAATAQWRKVVQEVMTDVMLEMEGLELCTSLVYIFKQDFSFFPVSCSFSM